MSTEAIVPEVKTEVEVPQVFKARREIPIRDKDGNILGGMQVYEGTGPTQEAANQDLLDKMASGIENGTRKIREFSLLRKNGGIEAPNIPDGADIEDDELPAPKPKALTDAELFQLAQDMKDPAKIASAYDRLYEARTGAKPEDDAKLKQKQRDRLRVESATAAAEAFSRDNPEFYGTGDNRKAILDYMVSRDEVLRKGGKSFPWTKKNLEIAFRELKADGLLAERPKPVIPTTEEPALRTEAQEPEVVVPAPRKQDAFPSAIRPSQASGSEARPKPKGPSKAELAMMSPDKLREHLESQGLWGK